MAANWPFYFVVKRKGIQYGRSTEKAFGALKHLSTTYLAFGNTHTVIPACFKPIGVRLRRSINTAKDLHDTTCVIPACFWRESSPAQNLDSGLKTAGMTEDRIYGNDAMRNSQAATEKDPSLHNSVLMLGS